jgi:hypothetical protein
MRALAWKLASFRKPRAKPVRLAKSLATVDEPAVLSAAKSQAVDEPAVLSAAKTQGMASNRRSDCDMFSRE